LQKHIQNFIEMIYTTTEIFQQARRQCLDVQLPVFNPLNAELNPICHLLALLGAHHILHISELRVKLKMNPMSVFFNLQESMINKTFFRKPIFI